MKNRFLSIMILLAGVMMWGFGYIFQTYANQTIDPYSFGAIRFFLGALTLFPLAYLSQKKSSKPFILKDYLIAASLCGLALFLGALTQQIGLLYTSVGSAGFITSLFVVIVPVLCFFIYRRRISKVVLIALVVALIGVYLLSVTDGLSFNQGDIWVLVGAFFWAAQILLIEKYANNLNGYVFAVFEFLFAAFFHFILMLFLHIPNINDLLLAFWPIILSGCISVAVGFGAQVYGLKNLDSMTASLIMCLESVFAAIFGVIFFHELFTFRQLIGSILLFTAVIMIEVGPRLIKRYELKKLQ